MQHAERGEGPWWVDSVFYHIYPLGLCGAPEGNDRSSAPVPRIREVLEWLDHLESLGVSAVYIGPHFESTSHGYDTIDYIQVDRRLGTSEDLKAVTDALHDRGMRVVFDAVFNHVGRNFPAFEDLRRHGRESKYIDWFDGLDFSKRSPAGDPFTYEGWAGHHELVKLKLENPAVRDHIFAAVRQWIELYNIDGLRLDAADKMPAPFFRALRDFVTPLRSDFWLMGEVVHGDYRHWLNEAGLDAVTNYECYKGLYSSHVDRNFHEIAYSLNRQFGPDGMYRGKLLYNFADNHDVDRVASSLDNARDLYSLYAILFTMPGIPSLYYGSEWGMKGRRTEYSDEELRPALERPLEAHRAPQPDLPRAIKKLAELREAHLPLRLGDYRQLHVAAEQLVFERSYGASSVVVGINAAAHEVELEVTDRSGKTMSLRIPANWLTVLSTD